MLAPGVRQTQVDPAERLRKLHIPSNDLTATGNADISS